MANPCAVQIHQVRTVANWPHSDISLACRQDSTTWFPTHSLVLQLLIGLEGHRPDARIGRELYLRMRRQVQSPVACCGNCVVVSHGFHAISLSLASLPPWGCSNFFNSVARGMRDCCRSVGPSFPSSFIVASYNDCVMDRI